MATLKQMNAGVSKLKTQPAKGARPAYQPWPNTGQVLIACILFTVISLLLLRQFPQWDIAISNVFFTVQDCASLPAKFGGNPDASQCGQFTAVQSHIAQSLRATGVLIPRITIVALIMWSLFLWYRRGPNFRHNWQNALVAIISLLAGPILIVNFWLKTYAGRARPFRTTDFGGEWPYSLPGDFVNNCNSNCSFTSGESAGAVWMFAIVLIAPARWRLPLTVIVAAFAFAVSTLRVSFGRHYFSDVFMSTCISFTAIALAVWIVHSYPAWRKSYSRPHD